MKLKNNYGKVAIEINSVRAASDVLVIKAEALGTMPITVHVTADDMWAAREYITWTVIRRVVGLFYRGWRRSRAPAPQPMGSEKVT